MEMQDVNPIDIAREAWLTARQEYKDLMAREPRRDLTAERHMLPWDILAARKALKVAQLKHAYCSHFPGMSAEYDMKVAQEDLDRLLEDQKDLAARDLERAQRRLPRVH